MADISMCDGKHCKDKDTCYRYTAHPSTYQSYLLLDNKNKDKDTCEYYWNNKYKGIKRINSKKI